MRCVQREKFKGIITKTCNAGCLLHPSVTLPVNPTRWHFCVSPDNFSTPRHPLQYQIRPDENFSSRAIKLVSPVPNDHWPERQSGVNLHRLNLEIVRIQLVKSGGARILSSPGPFFCSFVTFANSLNSQHEILWRRVNTQSKFSDSFCPPVN